MWRTPSRLCFFARAGTSSRSTSSTGSSSLPDVPSMRREDLWERAVGEGLIRVLSNAQVQHRSKHTGIPIIETDRTLQDFVPLPARRGAEVGFAEKYDITSLESEALGCPARCSNAEIVAAFWDKAAQTLRSSVPRGRGKPTAETQTKLRQAKEFEDKSKSIRHAEDVCDQLLDAPSGEEKLAARIVAECSTHSRWLGESLRPLQACHRRQPQNPVEAARSGAFCAEPAQALPGGSAQAYDGLRHVFLRWSLSSSSSWMRSPCQRVCSTTFAELLWTRTGSVQKS